jgi:tRNA dimethylallyltransferase
MERDALYARIEARIDAMIAAGAADEVRAADAAGASSAVRQALGFRELLDGDVDAMKTRTGATPSASSPGCASSRTC